MWLFYTIVLVIGVVVFWGALKSTRNTINVAAKTMELSAARYAASNLVELTPEEIEKIKEVQELLK